MSGTTFQPITRTPDIPCSVGTLGDEGWLEHDGNCYRVYSKVEVSAKSWNDARKHCQGDGAELASVLSEDENSFILSKVQS